MKFLALAALPALVAAQYGAPPSGGGATTSSSSSSAAAAAVPTAAAGQHIVVVGENNGVMFTPSTVTAAQNETVTFVFNEFDGTVMHSVTQSTFAAPCTLANGGFDSGFQPTNNQFTITIMNASQPIWFFCQQINPLKHCNLGMVGGINVPASGTNDFANFSLAASTAAVPTQTGSGILSGIGAAATAPAAPGGSASASAAPSSAMRLVAGAGSLLAGLFAVVYTLA
ncbi:Cupredoxin [Gautieria morchelliformis]|nr:Cupredoxin [Gautieria morchelliformis]